MLNISNAIQSILLPPAIVTMMAFGNVSTSTEVEVKNMEFNIEASKVDRVEVLKNFFAKYDSPLVDHSDTFVQVADLYGIDYKLLPAISCMESTCGKFIPYNSNNAFGWGVYGGNYISFETHDEAIQTVGEGLNKNYFSKGLDTIEEIAPVYTPPNSHNWANGVRFFTSQMDEIEQMHQPQS